MSRVLFHSESFYLLREQSLNDTNMDFKNVESPISSRHSPTLTAAEHLTSSGLYTNVILLTISPQSLHPKVPLVTLPVFFPPTDHHLPVCSHLGLGGKLHEGRILSVLSCQIPNAKHRAAPRCYINLFSEQMNKCLCHPERPLSLKPAEQDLSAPFTRLVTDHQVSCLFLLSEAQEASHCCITRPGSPASCLYYLSLSGPTAVTTHWRW